MTTTNVRANLRRAREEIEEARESSRLSESAEKRLERIAVQFRYLTEGAWTDPEAVARPDPAMLETVGDHLAEIGDEVNDDVAVRIENAREEISDTVSVLDRRLERQHRR